MYPANFTDGNDLDLTCAISQGNYSTVTLLKVSGQTEEELVVHAADGSVTVKASRESAADVTAATGSSPRMLRFTLIGAGCEDKGMYACRHDNGQTSFAEASIHSESFHVL